MRLFKYVRAERIDILEGQRIAFTPPEEFNDALDMRPRVIPMTSVAVLKRKAKAEEAEVLRHMPPNFKALPRNERRRIGRELFKGSIKHIQANAEAIAGKLQEDIYSHVNREFGVLCLTTNPDHKLMWGHYADGHKGFVLEFDTEKPRFASGLHRIVYSDRPATYDPAGRSADWWKVKGKVWEYEGEYRLVSKLCDCEKIVVNGKGVYLRCLPRDCVKAVFLGLKTDPAIKKRIRDVCQASGIRLYETVISSSGPVYEFRQF